MIPISFQSIVEAAWHSENMVENASGMIQKPEEILSHQNLEALERVHRGVFAFLAFHPDGDQVIRDYILQGTLSDDSGTRVLVLFVLDRTARWPKRIEPSDFGDWVKLDRESHPCTAIPQLLFKSKVPPALPGLIFFEKFSITEPVYVSLDGTTSVSEVRDLVREVSVIATKCLQEQGIAGEFAGRFSIALSSSKHRYSRANTASVLEWLGWLWKKVVENRQDLVSLLTLATRKTK